MKLIFSFLIFSFSILSFAQNKVNSSVLERISTESSAKYKRNLADFEQKLNVSKELKQDLLNRFAGFVLGSPVYYQTNDTRQAFATNTDLLYNNSIPGVQVTGSGMKAFMWDGGNVRTTHTDLTGRITNKESGTNRDHATGVAGVIIGTGNGNSGGNNSKGMAYQATLNTYNYTNNFTEIATESANTVNAEYFISNHSYGTIAGWEQGNYGMGNGWYWFGNDIYSSKESIYFGYYGGDDVSFDEIAYNSPQHTIIKSASNDNNQGPGTTLAQHWAYNSSWQWQAYNNVFRPNDCGQTGYDCIPTSSLAKNIITVGSVQVLNNRYSQPSDVLITSDSSFGPADDGRIKPDVVAVGSNVYAPGAASNSQFLTWNGTSFSAPAVTGNIVLLQQLYKQQYGNYLRSDLTKAIVIHSANEAGSAPGPDYKFGWGLMDSAAAAELIMGKDDSVILENHTLNNNETYSFSVKGIENTPLKVTIVWLDPKGTIGAGHNERSPKLINDLDLRINDGIITYEPWMLDVNNPSASATKGDNVLDNVEQILIDNPVEGLDYEITISHKGSLQNDAQIFAIVVSGGGFCPRTTWDGLTWNNGIPDLTKKAIVNGELILDTDLQACELEITENGSVEIPDGFNFTINGIITNNGTAEDFMVASGANLIQNEDVENTGEIIVMRVSQPFKRLDYTMWSSPVAGQQLQAFSPMTLPGRIYTYEGTSQYIPVTDATSDFTEAKGYLFRAPNDWGTTPSSYSGEFTGIPFNGNSNIITHAGNYTSIGNPYPSNINADDLMETNNDISALYFWTNVNPVEGGAYSGNNYATYTSMGGTSADGGSIVPNGVISVGQGFIVETAGSSVNFTNEMRTSDETDFFKIEDEKSRLWLNLSDDTNQKFNQILVGYMEGATQGEDNQIDGRLFGYQGSALYSVINEEKFTIQGRTLPFEISDVVQLGFKAENTGKFVVSLADFDGLFAEGETVIYLKDKQLNLIHNLMDSDYIFESNSGEFKDRFEIVYEDDGTMASEDIISNNIRIYKHNQQVVIESKTDKILSVEVYDLIGRNIHKNENINANIYSFKSNVKGVIIVKAMTQNGEVATKKIIAE